MYKFANIVAAVWTFTKKKRTHLISAHFWFVVLIKSASKNASTKIKINKNQLSPSWLFIILEKLPPHLSLTWFGTCFSNVKAVFPWLSSQQCSFSPAGDFQVKQNFKTTKIRTASLDPILSSSLQTIFSILLYLVGNLCCYNYLKTTDQCREMKEII